jgi:hypothetical protein
VRQSDLRFGAFSGIAFVILIAISIAATLPDAPTDDSTAREVIDYFTDKKEALLVGDGLTTAFAGFFFLWFLSALRSALVRAEGDSSSLAPLAFGAGLLYIGLAMVAVAVEVFYAGTLDFFENFDDPDASLGFAAVSLSTWIYVYSSAAAAVMIGASSVVASRTGVLPGWLAYAGYAIALLDLLALFIYPAGAALTLLWVLAVSVVLLTRPARA